MKKTITSIALVLLSTIAFGNNVNLTNVSILNNGPDSVQVQFDLSWENSWRVNTGPNNYDGVYVFFKYRTPGGVWLPLYLTYTDNVLPTGATTQYNFSSSAGSIPGEVVFRSGNGIGNVSFTGIKLGVDAALPYNIEVRGFALEVVYIPKVLNPNGFIIGDGDGTNEAIYAFHATSLNNKSVQIPSTGSIAVDVNFFDDAILEAGVSVGDELVGGNGSFPVTSGMWCMKYELSQAAYRDFLNTLTVAQQTTRTATAPTSVTGTGALIAVAGTGRMYIEVATPASGATPAVYGCDANNNNTYDEATDGEWVSCNYLSWGDVAAYLAWCGMAPMTELGYERICRGNTVVTPMPSIYGEYAWGSNTLNSSALSLANATAANETANGTSLTLGNANTLSNAINGPARNGIFAGPSTSRITSGAAFFGVMDMTGNLGEPCITIGNVAGRSFSKGFSFGTLSTLGNATALPWPNNTIANNSISCSTGCEITGSAGTIVRGADFGYNGTTLFMSDRTQGVFPSSRLQFYGCRGIFYLETPL